MISSSTLFSFTAIPRSSMSYPFNLLYFPKYGRVGPRGRGRADGGRGGELLAVRLPPFRGLSQLEEGDDPGRDREPEGDQTVDQDRGEDVGSRKPEEDEGADQPRIHRADATWRAREQVGGHSDEESLHEDRDWDVHRERLEARPQDGDVRGPEPNRPDDRESSAAGIADEGERGARSTRHGRGRGGEPPHEPPEPVALRKAAQAPLEVLGDQRNQQKDRDHRGRQGGRDD